VIEIRNNANFHWGLTTEKLEPRARDKKEEHKEVLNARDNKKKIKDQPDDLKEGLLEKPNKPD
jgi:hypothetical protein